MFNRPAILALFVVLISAVIFSFFRGHRLRKIMPPSPPGLPVLGNILQLPRLNPWIQFTDWRYQYGPIYSLNVAGQAVIVLNSFDTVTDLLDRRSSIYSDRPRSIMAGEILGGGIILAFMGYGERWRRLRRIAFGGFTVRASVDYQPMQERESARLVAHLLRDPMQYDDHFKRNAASTVLTALYDRPLVDSTIDQVARDINEVAKSLSNAGAVGAYLVDIFPAMLYLPEWLARWKREGRQLHEKYSAMLEGFLLDVQNRLVGCVQPVPLFDCSIKISFFSRLEI
ncbi:hypothetical protein PHLCEN_2v7650 [Hermanssonia centrifuga]|uniref:Cytochrome P450 n=1 Tax=Hermanssonia centrifuga TaxID=98765 RepID=A0A2R6NVW8_9APHY|nr:hypothetical protein PHLCEN_2v7650 [Hermanssonia centrifuga]